MFSVKWVYENDGLLINRIFEAETVTVAFPDDGPPGSPRRQGAPQLMGRDVHSGLLIVGPGFDLDDRSIDRGKVYVMNQAGRTVATYELGEPTDLLPRAAPLNPPSRIAA